jgi:hypothetical protein
MKPDNEYTIVDMALFMIIAIIFVMLVVGSLYGFIMFVSRFVR